MNDGKMMLYQLQFHSQFQSGGIATTFDNGVPGSSALSALSRVPWYVQQDIFRRPFAISSSP
jgi:hypothetical protein